MTTQNSNTKFDLNSNTRLSVSSWQDGKFFCQAVAIFRLDNGKWSLDHTTATEIRKDRIWLAESTSVMVQADLYKQEIGHVMPLGFYRNNKA